MKKRLLQKNALCGYKSGSQHQVIRFSQIESSSQPITVNLPKKYCPPTEQPARQLSGNTENDDNESHSIAVPESEVIRRVGTKKSEACAPETVLSLQANPLAEFDNESNIFEDIQRSPGFFNKSDNAEEDSRSQSSRSFGSFLNGWTLSTFVTKQQNNHLSAITKRSLQVGDEEVEDEIASLQAAQEVREVWEVQERQEAQASVLQSPSQGTRSSTSEITEQKNNPSILGPALGNRYTRADADRVPNLNDVNSSSRYSPLSGTVCSRSTYRTEKHPVRADGPRTTNSFQSFSLLAKFPSLKGVTNDSRLNRELKREKKKLRKENKREVKEDQKVKRKASKLKMQVLSDNANNFSLYLNTIERSSRLKRNSKNDIGDGKYLELMKEREQEAMSKVLKASRSKSRFKMFKFSEKEASILEPKTFQT